MYSLCNICRKCNYNAYLNLQRSAAATYGTNVGGEGNFEYTSEIIKQIPPPNSRVVICGGGLVCIIKIHQLKFIDHFCPVTDS